MIPEIIQLRAGIVYVNREPALRFASTAQAGVFLTRLGYRASERGHVWTFWKPVARLPGCQVSAA